MTIRLVLSAVAVVLLTLCADAGYGQEVRLTDKVAYYDDGKIRGRTLFAPNGEVLEKLSYYDDGALQKMECFDRAGNKVVEAHYDSNGHLAITMDGWAAQRWLYKDGQLRAETTYGPDKRLQERKIYNDLGDLVGRQYANDTPMNESEEFNRGSVATNETDKFYDRYGRQTGSVTTSVNDPEYMLDGWPYWW